MIYIFYGEMIYTCFIFRHNCPLRDNVCFALTRRLSVKRLRNCTFFLAVLLLTISSGKAEPAILKYSAGCEFSALQKEDGSAKTLVRPDLTLYYKVFGQGKPVLVLNGGPGFSGELVEPIARVIARRGCAIVPDQRGTGHSIPEDETAITLDNSIADFEALRDELGYAQWTVLGTSWGGMIAMDYASKHPESLKGLVLVDSGGTSAASFSRAFIDNITARMTSDDRAAGKFWAQPEIIARDPYRAAIESMRCMIPAEYFDRSKAWRFIAGMKVGKQHYNPAASKFLSPEYEKQAASRIEALGKIDIPTLIMHGRQDPMPESVALGLHELLRGSRLVFIDRCGHMPWIEQPEEFKKTLFEFLFD